MNSGQTFLLIGALVLIGLLALAFQGSFGDKMGGIYLNEAVMNASATGQSLLDVIQTRAFDERTRTVEVSVVDSLSSTLGPDASESDVTFFDDVDDFNGYNTVDTTSNTGETSIQVTVGYVTLADPGTITGARTFAKIARIKLMNSYLLDTVRVSRVITY